MWSSSPVGAGTTVSGVRQQVRAEVREAGADCELSTCVLLCPFLRLGQVPTFPITLRELSGLLAHAQ